MDLDPQTFFLNITESLQDPEEKNLICFRLLDSFYRNLIEEQIDSSLIDQYLPHFYHTTNSLLSFVEKSSRIPKLSKSCLKSIEILYTILNNFYDRIPEKDILCLYKTVTNLIKSSLDSQTKVKLYNLVLRSLEKSDGIVDDNAHGVYNSLNETLIKILQTKSSDTARNKEMELAGYLSKKYPFLINDHQQIKRALLRNFEFLCVNKKQSQYVINGFYTGFGYYLENFPLNNETPSDKKYIIKLYTNLKSLVILKPNEHVKFGNRAALTFFAYNIELFKESIIKEYKYWHTNMLHWLQAGAEEKKVGKIALRAFYNSLSKASEDNNSQQYKEIVQYFLMHCKRILSEKDSSIDEKRLAICCLREFSGAAHIHLEPQELSDIFLVIMQIFENTFMGSYNPQDEEWDCLPDYIQTVAKFMRFKEFLSSHFFCLQKGVINMIKSFHQLPYLHHGLVVDSLGLTLFYLKNTEYFESFIENIIYQGVVWSCSHQHVAAEAFSHKGPQKLITVKNYYYLWSNLLKLSSNRYYDKYGFYLEDRKFVLERIVNELVKTLMVLVNKLNVSISLKDNTNILTELERAYKVEESNDYAIFLNVVDFYKDIFDNIEPKMFSKCITKMIDHLISKCIKYPLISGLYKLLSYCLKISHKLDLFNNESETIIITNCRETLTAFLTILLNKMTEFKDDLLISCLQVLLETPVQIIEQILPLCVIPFTNIFEVGRSYLPLAEVGIDTLENWQKNFSPEVFDPFLANIIPSLDSFLRSKFLKGYSTKSAEKRRKTMRALKKRQILEEVEPELVKLQRKILCFIGRQNVKNCQNFIFSDKSFDPNLMIGNSSHLKLTLPYNDLQLDMYLDAFLPRIIELALYSSDRKTRIISCELLQACFMVFLGRAKQMSSIGLEDLNNMLKSLALPLLQLGCDIDQVVRQIFEPLCLQLIHWYTSPTQTRGSHTSIIIEALMEGISHPTNSNLKDFSGTLINEFVKWTLKHQHLDPEGSIKVLVKHMRYFSGHPDLAKKMGAALIFNSTYVELREQQQIVSIFWLEILQIFVLSLDSIPNYEETAAVTQIKQSLSHLQRVLMEKPSMFRKEDKKRRVPNDFNDGLLIDVALWLLKQTSSSSKHCRQACMELFTNIAPLSIESRLTLHEFVLKYLGTSLSVLYDTKLTTFTFLKEQCHHNSTNLLNYLRNLLCCLDGYKFIIQNNLETINFNEKIFDEIQFFLEHIQTADFLTCLNQIQEKSWNYTTLDKDIFIHLKTSCIFSILKMFNALIHDEELCEKANKLWNGDFWRLLSNCLYYPQDLGINDIILNYYRDVLLILLNVIPKKLKHDAISSLQIVLQTSISNFSVISIDKNVSLRDRNLLKGVILLNSSYVGKQVEHYAQAINVLQAFISDFYDKAVDNIVFINHIPDTTFSYLSSLLKFILSNNPNEISTILNKLLFSNYNVQTIDMVRKKNAGLFFITNFSDAIVPAIILNLELFLNLGLSTNPNITVELIIFTLGYIIREKQFRLYYKQFVNTLLLFWVDFVVVFNTSTETMELGYEFLTLIVQISEFGKCDDIYKWLMECLMKPQDKHYFSIFALLGKLIRNDLTENQSNDLKSALYVLDEKISNQSNQDLITNDYNKLITIFPVVKSIVIFEYLINTYTKTNHNLNIYNVLTKFIQQIDKSEQNIFLEKAYEIVPLKVITDILPPLFLNADIEVFEQFYVKHIEKILSKFEQDDLSSGILNFVLLEMLYLRIPVGSDERKDCPLSPYSKQILSYTLNAFKLEKKQNDLVRKYKCHAYNALASMVSNSFRKLSFYEKLFIRESNNEDVLWHGIVNIELNYDFPKEFDTLPAQKKILVSIRNELRQSREKAGSMLNSPQYIGSQKLFNSSLSEDVTKFDFSHSILRSEYQADKKVAEISHMQSEIYLDMTEINNHECMATICSLIQHIFDTGVCILPLEDEDDIVLPKWMNGIRSLLLKENTHKNVKIFLVKIIDNMLPIFNRYAKFFLEPLIQFVVDKVAGDTINYFVTDVLVIISRWSLEIPNLSITESRLASNLLEQFIKNMENDRRVVFKYNIELLKLLVESWKNHLTAPIEIIHERLANTGTSEIGIYVSSVLLVNNIELWHRGKEQDFLNLMLKRLDTTKRRIYRGCSETLGALLNILRAPEFVNSVNTKLKTLSPEKYVDCLEGVAIKFPEIVDIFHISTLIIGCNQAPHAQKVINLKIIHRRLELSLDFIQDISEFKIIDWDELIEDSNIEIQILALEIVKKCIILFSTFPTFSKIIKTLNRNICHPNAIFRGCLYDTAISIYELKKDLDDSCKEILIFGLIDPDYENQTKVTEFWTNNSDLPNKVTERFPYLLSQMYKTKIEDRLLGLSSYFLLTLLIDSEKYDLEIFEHPLEDCDFEEYILQTNWKLQHPSVVPMFAQTLDVNSIENLTSMNQSDFLLRKTQSNLEFIPTQSSQEQQLTKITSLESTLGVDLEESFKDPNNVSLSQKYKFTKKRFLKDKSKIAKSMANYEVSQKVQKEKERKESDIERQRNVTIYRSYRKGDFPDIQIALSAVLKPLQILALYDNEISKILFLEIFKGISTKMENNVNFLRMVSDSIQNICKCSIQFNRYLFSAILDILLRNKKSIKLDPALIAQVSQESGLNSVGALLIEEYIILGLEDDCPSTSKRKFGEDSKEIICWVKLAELYKDLEEWDVVRSIFLEKMDCKDSVQKALTFESQSFFREAQELYKDLIESDSSKNRKDFYYESYFKCFASLCEWENIPKEVTNVVKSKDTWKSLWEDTWCKQKLLPWYIKAHIRNQLFEEGLNQDFLMNLNECLTHPQHREYLTTNFSEELSILWLCQDDTTTAHQYLKTNINTFLDDWQIINPIFQSQRFQKLLKLQNVIEIADFIDLYDNLTDDIDNSLNLITERWKKNELNMSPSLILSETKLLYRRQFIKNILNKLSKIEALNLKKEIKNMHVIKVTLDLDFIQTAADLGNFYVTRKYLNKYIKKENDKLNLSKGTAFILKANMAKDLSLKMKILLEAAELFGELTITENPNITHLKATTKLFDTYIIISQLTSSNTNLFSQYQENLASLTKGSISTSKDIELYSYNFLKTFTENCIVNNMDVDNYEDKNTIQKIKHISDAYLKLAYFIRDKKDDNLQGDFILFVLRAMKLNSSEARQLFPCILMQSNLGTTYKDVVIEEIDKIPTWMFLGWIPQLLANVDSPKIFVISRIILRIAETYPQSIMYPYRLSKENYNFENNDVAVHAKPIIDRLDYLLLKDEKINMFLRALSYVSMPGAILKYHLNKIYKLKTPEEIKAYVDMLQKDLFDQPCKTNNVTNLQGNMYQKIAKYKNEFTKFTKGMTPDKSKLHYLKLKKEFDCMLVWDKKIKTSCPSLLLKDYSPWLANFSANKLDIDLEIPGQYDGQKLPITQHHVRISSFHPEIRIMQSIRRPIKITILGMNTKEYQFLLKFGEDIRQDQRIEQLFYLMNGFLRNDILSSNNGLEILTYQVIPLTSNLGLIQWVNNTQPLSEFAKKSLKNKKEIEEFEYKLRYEYEKNLNVNSENYFESHGNSAIRINKEKIILRYQTIVKKVPWDLLRTSLWSLSSSTENYIALRNNFIKTYAVICASHWILGIGDRHLENSLINLRNGKVLGIDFGHAFGTATQMQYVPELVPFRLTPHLIHLMEPLRERGPFREYMIHCLKCFRANRQSLLATMNVFIQEPSLDWLEHSEAVGDSSTSNSTHNESWYPLVKIEQAKRKLNGANSVNIMVEELSDGCRVQNYTDAYIKHVKGQPEANFRSKFIEREDLSVEEQVDCLIDHATDYNLLGRMFSGWSSWI